METHLATDVGALVMRDDDNGESVRFCIGDQRPGAEDCWVFRVKGESLTHMVEHLVSRAPDPHGQELSELRTENELLRVALADANAKIGSLEVATQTGELTGPIADATLAQPRDIDHPDTRDLRERFGRVISENAELINARMMAERERDKAIAERDALRVKLEYVQTGDARLEEAASAAEDQLDQLDLSHVLRDFVPTHVVMIKDVKTPDGLRIACLATLLRNVTPTIADATAGRVEIGDRVYETMDGSRRWSEKPSAIYYKGEHVGRALGPFVAAFGNRATVEILPCDEQGRVLK